MDAFTNSDSESDENVEDLLSEYQHYLEKAHEQRRLYLEKTNKTKNKVPVLRHDSFVKANLPVNLPSTFDRFHNNVYSTNNYYNPGILKFPPPPFGSPLDIFIPVVPPFSYNLNKPEHETVIQRKLFDGKSLLNFEKTQDDKIPLSLPPLFPKPTINEPIKSPCICSSSTMPCKCNCKQCVMPLNLMKSGLQSPNPDTNRRFIDPRIQENVVDDMKNTANTLNVKIKVDIQLPKVLNGKQFNRDSALEYEDSSKEFTSNIRLPTTSFNFPIPIDLLGYKRSPKINRHDVSPFRKITIHKKKRSRSNNNNKKHRKKLITFHNVKLAPTHTLKPLVKEHYNITLKNRTVDNFNETDVITTTENFTLVTLKTDAADSTTSNADLKNSTQYEEGIYFTVNISNNNENDAEEGPKTGNSIELEFKTKPNISTILNMREKRDLHVEPKNNMSNFNITKKTNVTQNKIITKDKKFDDKSKQSPDKEWFSDAELLYWPSSAQINVSVIKPKNITDIILEREHKKAKLNITKETIRHNHTQALEQAIFGQVDWNDMDAVAPTFISFVGKYINGIITFCSPNICHSMKCAEKSCIHRTCLPDDRFNHIGHCSGSNKTGK